MLKEIVATLKKANGALITAHERPDGDALGSALALERALQAIGVRTVIMLKDPVPETYKFLRGSENILSPSYLGWQPEVIIALDSTEWGRIGDFIQDLNMETISINIDHHPSNKYFADLNWVDPQASATGEMIFQLITLLGVKIDLDMATAMYTALATDTGFFRHPNTTVKSLELAAKLAGKGAEPAQIYEWIHGNRSLASIKVLSRALAGIQLSPCGKVAWMGLKLSDLEEFQIKEEELEGMVNYPKSLRGVKIALLFRETEKDLIRVSLRARGSADVNLIAQNFAGGGHKEAAGCTVKGAWDDAIEQVVNLCIKQVGEV